MAKRVSLRSGCVLALQTYLKNELAPIPVLDDWPSPDDDPLVDKDVVVTVLAVGEGTETFYDPHVIATQDGSSAGTKLYTWSLASVTQPLQIDVWAKHAPARDDVLANLKTALHRGLGYTLGKANADPFRHGVLLPLQGNWSGNVDCVFDREAALDGADTVQQGQFRATLKGEAQAEYTEIEESVKLATIKFKERLRQAGVAGTYSGTFDLQVTQAGAYSKDVT